MASNGENPEILTNRRPRIFSASSLLFREWLLNEVQMRDQVNQASEKQDNDRIALPKAKRISSHHGKKC